MKSLTLLSLGLSSVLLLGATSPASAAGEVDPERVVRAAYDRLSSYSVLAETPISFELSDFRTLEGADLETVRYTDLVDMPSGMVIDMHRAFKTNAGIDARRVVYEPSWREMEPLWKSAPESGRLAHLSAAEVLAEAKDNKGKSRLASVDQVTVYTVTALLGDESRTYSAAFLWTPSQRLAGYDTAFVVVDNITQGVEEAVRENVAPMMNPDFMELSGDLAPTKATCSSWSSNFYSNRSAQNSNGHAWGQHKSTANFKITCSCSSNCYSRCAASMTSGSCSDSGFTEMCHKMASASDASTTQNYQSGAGCSVGWGCVQKPCLFCLCGLSVSVSANGAGVSFSSSGANWTGNVKFEMGACAPCS